MAKATVPTPLSSQLLSVTKSGYSPDKLYIDTTDRNGHYERVQARVPPPVEALILQALNDNPGYNKSVQSFIRDAIIHRLAYLQQNPGSTIDPVQAQLTIIRHEMDALAALDNQVKSDIAQFEQMVETCVEIQEWSAMNLFIERFDYMLNELNLSDGHRQMIEDAIESATDTMAKATTRRRRR